MNDPHYEVQILPPDAAGRLWQFTVRISRGTDQWTSAPVALVATTEAEARHEAADAARRLVEALS